MLSLPLAPPPEWIFCSKEKEGRRGGGKLWGVGGSGDGYEQRTESSEALVKFTEWGKSSGIIEAPLKAALPYPPSLLLQAGPM